MKEILCTSVTHLKENNRNNFEHYQTKKKKKISQNFRIRIKIWAEIIIIPKYSNCPLSVKY